MPQHEVRAVEAPWIGRPRVKVAAGLEREEDDLMPSFVQTVIGASSPFHQRAASSGLASSTVAAALLMVGPAQAASAPPQYYTSLGGYRDSANDSGPFSEHSPTSGPYGTAPSTPQSMTLTGGNGWMASADSNAFKGGTVSVLAEIPYQGGVPARITELDAQAWLDYRFVIDGPDSNAKVPVFLNSVATSEGTVPAQLQLIFKSDDDAGFAGYTTNPDAGAFTVDSLFYLQPGKTYELNLRAEAYVLSYYLGDDEVASASATIDPTFTIQGDFAKDYHFVGLPDSAIGRADAAVPEPASWTMMVGGFGMLGGTLRRRRQPAARQFAR